MRKVLVLVWLATSSVFAQEGRLIRNPIRNIPGWVRTEFAAQHLDRTYTIVYRLYPYILRGDFNGDTRKDVAIQISENQTGKIGFAIFHGKKIQALFTNIAVVGAGKSLPSMGDDLAWANVWNAHRASTQKYLSNVRGDVLAVERRDSTAGFIYWDGKKYDWHRTARKSP